MNRFQIYALLLSLSLYNLSFASDSEEYVIRNIFNPKDDIEEIQIDLHVVKNNVNQLTIDSEVKDFELRKTYAQKRKIADNLNNVKDNLDIVKNDTEVIDSQVLILTDKIREQKNWILVMYRNQTKLINNLDTVKNDTEVTDSQVLILTDKVREQKVDIRNLISINNKLVNRVSSLEKSAQTEKKRSRKGTTNQLRFIVKKRNEQN